MPDIQNEINKLFEQRKNEEQLASSIVSQRNEQFEEFLKKRQNEQELTNNIVGQKNEQFKEFLNQQQEKQMEIIKQQELTYESSLYYQNYQVFLNSLEQYVISMYYEIIQIYQRNNLIYKDPYYEEVKNQKFIVGIGYPVPDKYLKQIKEIVENKLKELSVIEDGEFKVDIIPAKYVQQGNILKEVNSYSLEITLNKKMKKNKLK